MNKNSSNTPLFREKVVGENFLIRITNSLRSFLYDKYKTHMPVKHSRIISIMKIRWYRVKTPLYP